MKANRTKIIKGVVSLLMLAGITALPVVAWFHSQRTLARMQRVNPPDAIYLSAAHRENEVNFQVGGVDVADLDHQDYVFSVAGKRISTYRLRLAHTTNNPFTYTLYEANFYDSATKPATGEFVEYRASGVKTPGADAITVNPDVTGGETYYYSIKTQTVGETTSPVLVSGRVLNADSNDSSIAAASGQYHTYTYGSQSTNIQKNAEPLYWISNDITGSAANSPSFCHNYILRVSWDPEEVDLLNRETDIIYLYVNGSI